MMKNQTDTGIGKKGKPGFKLTKLGWIPEEWEVKNLGEISIIIMGQSPTGNTYNSEQLGKPLINGPTEFTRRFPIKKQWTSQPTKECIEGDILLCIRGSSTGRINISDGNYCIGRGIAAIRNVDISDISFLEYLLTFSLPLILQNTSGSTFPNIDNQSLKSLQVRIPPLPEQQKIARILSIWDKAIEKTEQLIQAKTQLKKGLMQQLLTGKKRLPGYKSNWEKFTVDKIFNFIKTYSYTRDDLIVSGDIHYIHYGDIHTKFHNERLDLSQEKSLPYVETNLISLALLHDNDIVMADVSEDYDGTGKCIELYNVGILKIIAGLHTIALRRKSSKIAQGYGPYLFMNPLVKRELCKIATGISVYGIAKTNLGNIELFVPSLEEQEKITLIFNDLLKEISLLQMQLDRLKKQKAGLMQKLLTGEVKV